MRPAEELSLVLRMVRPKEFSQKLAQEVTIEFYVTIDGRQMEAPKQLTLSTVNWAQISLPVADEDKGQF